MQSIPFTKMSGAGNDFIMLYQPEIKNLKLDKSSVAKLCDRHNGIGADGLIIISDSEKYDFEMEYFNADGSTGSLCGNGARCSILYAKNYELVKKNKVKFISNGNEYTGEYISDKTIKFNLRKPEKVKLNFKVKAGGQLITSNYIHTGSPHIVIFVEEILVRPGDPLHYHKSADEIDVISLGREIRYLPEFAPAGVNVNFVQVEKENLRIRTYERGVENETLACGTGSVASALAAAILKNFSSPVKLITRGNEKLFVDFDMKNQEFTDVSLMGPAREIYAGKIQKSFLE